ncbi:MAG: SDR family oxidoreductase [Gammaproteobacteria bacterium]|nr:SDR family oxidoreductase [Gammaproteobacteria bacterium]
MSKTILITGASSGMGKAIASQRLVQGDRVIGMARWQENAPIAHDNFFVERVDFAKISNLPTVIEKLNQRYPDLSGLICCAGYGHFASLEEFSYTQIQKQFDVNFLAHVYLVRGLLSRLKKNAPSDIIFMGSEAALQGARKGTIYCASKFALRGFAQSLREESAKAKLRVTMINPGMVDTEFYKELNFAPGKAIENAIAIDDIVAAVDLVLASQVSTVFEEINLRPLNKVIHFKKDE